MTIWMAITDLLYFWGVGYGGDHKGGEADMEEVGNNGAQSTLYEIPKY